MLFKIVRASGGEIEYLKINNLLELFDLQRTSQNYSFISTAESYFSKCKLIVDFYNAEITIYDDYIE